LKKILKKILHILPFKKQVFSVIKFLFRPSESIYRHLYFKGVFRVKVDATHSFKIMHYGYQLENEVFWSGLNGNWEKHSMQIWIKLCRHASSIFDIGANTGIYSLVAQSINPKAAVYAFEPVGTVYQKMVANNTLNNFSINCYELALSDTDGRLSIFKVNAEHTYEATLNKRFDGFLPDAKAMQVEVMTMKTFVEKNKITNIDLVKIDVETHEPEVMAGFGEYLAKFKPVILIELITDFVVEGVIPAISGLDYLYFNIDEKKGIHQVKTLELSDSFNFLFCTREKAVELKLLA
jgi:FkbM family methyltransferase